jgi:hypothetical protein
MDCAAVQQCAAVRQCAAVCGSVRHCGSVWQCKRQCVAAHGNVCAVRALVCDSALGGVWQCA